MHINDDIMFSSKRENSNEKTTVDSVLVFSCFVACEQSFCSREASYIVFLWSLQCFHRSTENLAKKDKIYEISNGFMQYPVRFFFAENRDY